MNFKSFSLATIVALSVALLSFNFMGGTNPDSGVMKPAINTDNFDNSTSPATDFFQYVNGGWLKNNPIPATESSWGSFNELEEMNRKTLKKILEDAAANTNATKGSNTQKLGDYWAAGMDSIGIEAKGITPLAEQIAMINKMKKPVDLMKTLAYMNMRGLGSLFSIYVDQDAKVSTEYILNLSQGGLGLPDRDYYFNEDARSKNIQTEYKKYLETMLTLMGEKPVDAAVNGKAIYEMETRIAKACMRRVDMRDPYAVYHRMKLEEVKALSPNMDWTAYFTAASIPTVAEMNIAQPDYLKEISKMFKEVPMTTWKEYLKIRMISATGGMLSSAFVNERFRFFSTVLRGTPKMDPRWKRVLSNTNGELGEILGQEFVKIVFPPEAKQKALDLVNNLEASLKEKINALDWMSAETKTKAQEKLSTIMVKIGYPDKWKDYSSVEISRESYVKNYMNCDIFEWTDMMNKLGKPIDRTEWGMNPQTVNAYYNPAMNEIVFPAAILQPPFFNANADEAVNYGGIGTVIGHELTHGFDDEGRKFDAKGNLNEWWTEADAKKFDERTGVVVKQFNSIVALDTMHINGQLTLGENIADLGGLAISFNAMQKANAGKTINKIDGFTQEQRFFLSYANIWRGQYRPASLSQQLLTNPHSPGKWRVNVPLSNLPEFHKAFGLKEGDPMVKSVGDRARIW